MLRRPQDSVTCFLKAILFYSTSSWSKGVKRKKNILNERTSKSKE